LSSTPPVDEPSSRRADGGRPAHSLAGGAVSLGCACDDDRVDELTYPERLRGLSIPLARGLPCISGEWNVLLESRVIGRGDEEFARARKRIMSWEMHRGAGVRVQADGEVAVGAQARLSIGVGPLLIPARCEVVEVVDTDSEAGFAYGTLPGHPERGEEAFLIRQLENAAVVGSVAAFSRPARWGGPLVSPLAQRAQRIVARRYLVAMLR
jgi:uncharacterized protein (UPF0548 family)